MKLDLLHVKNFCHRIIQEDSPYSLMELINISPEGKEPILKAIRKYKSEHSSKQAGYIEVELVRRFLEPSILV
jgi:hypothetical protein